MASLPIPFPPLCCCINPAASPAGAPQLQDVSCSGQLLDKQTLGQTPATTSMEEQTLASDSENFECQVLHLLIVCQKNLLHLFEASMSLPLKWEDDLLYHLHRIVVKIL